MTVVPAVEGGVTGGGVTGKFEGWRSPTPHDTPLVEAAALPGSSGPIKPQAKLNGNGTIDRMSVSDSRNQVDTEPNGSNMGTSTNTTNGNSSNSNFKSNNTNVNANGTASYKNLHPSLHYPSFQSPCELSADGDMHSHAVDLLSFAKTTSSSTSSTTTDVQPQRSSASNGTATNGSAAGIAASVPTHTNSFLSGPGPTSADSQNGPTTASQTQGNGQPSRATARRMSSSTSQSRGKSGFLGAPNPAPPKDARPSGLPHSTSYNGAASTNQRGPSNGVAPQLYDFSKTDRPSHGPGIMGSRTTSTPAGGVAASLPVRGPLHDRLAADNALALQHASAEDMELDMQFGGSDDDDRAGSGRSGSADFDMDMDMDGDDTGEVVTQALGTGSGGVKGRRKGETFDCEFCGKTYRHPSCLAKHRWEHSPHWKDQTAANMSKHQQVQTLEAAAILTMGRSLPKDKSLWPSVVSGSGSNGHVRRNSRDPSAARSPPSSVLAPLTPSSLREPSSLGAMSERMIKERKSSPGSDSTTSSMGAGEPYPAANGNGNGGLGLRTQPPQPQPQSQNLHPSMGQRHPSFTRRASRTPSFSNSPGHPNSLPDMAGLHFQGSAAAASTSPIPNRGMPLSLQTRTGMIGGGMFGNQINTSVRSSSMRSGVDDLPEEDDDEDDDDRLASVHGHGHGHRDKSSSEEAEEARRAREGEEWGMAEEMEL